MAPASTKDIYNRVNELRREKRATQRRIEVDKELGKEPTKNDLKIVADLDIRIQELEQLLA